MDAETIIALANACNPWNKGAVTRLNEKIIRILQAEKIILEENSSQDCVPGTIVAIDEKGIEVSVTHNNRIRILYIYIDEGFLAASQLAASGISAGNCFQVI